MNWE